MSSSVARLGALTALLLCLALPRAWADDGPLEVGKVGVEVQWTFSVQGGGELLTVFADGRVQLAEIAGGPRATSRLRSGQLSAELQRELRKRVDASGLLGQAFTQKPKHPILSEGSCSLVLVREGKTTSLRPEPVEEPNADTKLLSEAMETFARELREFLEPHLGQPQPAGRYVRAVVQPTPAGKVPQAPGKLHDHHRRALATPGLYVRLPEGDTTQHGSFFDQEGQRIYWIVDTFQDARK